MPPLNLEEVGRDESKDAIDIGPATELTYRAHLQVADNYAVSMPMAIRIARDYGEYTSSYDVKKNVIVAERRLVMRLNELPAARKSDFESFRRVAGDDEDQRMSCSIAAMANAVAAPAPKVGDTADEIRDAGISALERRDYKTAIDLFKRLVEKDPSHQEGWDDLGRAYSGAHDRQQAIAAFRKQVEVNPFNQWAYNDLGSELAQDGKYDEAIAAFRKQLEVSPLDPSAHKNLGVLLASLKRYKDALPELETAARIRPDDPQVKMALAEAYARTGDVEKSKQMLASLTGSGVLRLGDLYSSALAENMNPADALREAQKVVDNVAAGYASGDLDIGKPNAFAAMHFLALAWARTGWARFLQGETLEGLRYLEAAFSLSQSGTVANRMARLYQKEGQAQKAEHMYALAVAAGGAEVEDSRARLQSAAGKPAADAIIKAGAELSSLRSVKLPPITHKTSTAEFDLIFDGSTQPDRVEFVQGDEPLKSAIHALMQADYPVVFPDAAPVKIVRRGMLSCGVAGCIVVLMPLETVAPPVVVEPSAAVSEKR